MANVSTFTLDNIKKLTAASKATDEDIAILAKKIKDGTNQNHEAKD